MWIKTYAVVSLDYIKVRITHITNFLVIVRDIILSHALLLVFFLSSKMYVPEVSLCTNISPVFIPLIGMYATCFLTNNYVRTFDTTITFQANHRLV